ncbi:MAG: hypothetical protein A2269_01785 [Lentisphaerae bacterium RIFOXYA12_FULL_60_10]|nr:MAG: hypothetical protein A2269_01785 [Lentisphaerae bacterium RIFOXYA12_FULL_60_10]
MSWGRRGWGRSRDYGYSRYPVYVPVAERRAKAEKQAAKLAGKGKDLQPVRLENRTIAHTFWGKAWCANLESYSDFTNRLPRGRSYVRNGSVLHLDVRKGEIEALVSGSSLYKIKIGIKPVDGGKWTGLCKECAGGIGSLMELLAGKLSERVMNVMTKPGGGLFPSPAEIKLNCSCPDWADMCKHVAAVMYGVGARLDQKPELLFLLRHVDHNELVNQASAVTALTDGARSTEATTLDEAEVGDVFGIELAKEAPAKADQSAMPKTRKSVPSKPAVSAKKKPAKKKSGKPVTRKRTVKGKRPRRSDQGLRSG